MRTVLALALALGLAACAPSTTLPAGHPALAGAPTGRLAGPPPALRVGVAGDTPAPAPTPAPVHHHH